MEIGLARGKKLYDKRDSIAKKDQQREALKDFKVRNLGLIMLMVLIVGQNCNCNELNY